VSDPYRIERLENWASDFVGSPAAERFPAGVREYASQVCAALLSRACEARGVEPEEVEEADLKVGLLEGVARLELPESVREQVPALCAAFLEGLEEQGRLGGGRSLGRYVAALREPYLAASTTSPKPIRNEAEKLGRNDPCPCGSGKKWKKCCMGLGGT
jgi:SEC-C motif-containing protein